MVAITNIHLVKHPKNQYQVIYFNLKDGSCAHTFFIKSTRTLMTDYTELCKIVNILFPSKEYISSSKVFLVYLKCNYLFLKIKAHSTLFLEKSFVMPNLLKFKQKGIIIQVFFLINNPFPITRITSNIPKFLFSIMGTTYFSFFYSTDNKTWTWLHSAFIDV